LEHVEAFARGRIEEFGDVILFGSGKGGVGKSVISTLTALELSGAGRRVGLLDLDFHGRSAAEMIGVSGEPKCGEEGLEPATVRGVRVFSVGFLVGRRPLPLKGPEARSLIPRLISAVDWGPLDHLVVDLPPGMGEEFLSISGLCRRGRLVLVTTPSAHSLSVVSLLSKLAKGEGLRVEGAVVNMSYIETEGGRLHLFGAYDVGEIEAAVGAPVLAEIPFDPGIQAGPTLLEARLLEGTKEALGKLTSRLLRRCEKTLL